MSYTTKIVNGIEVPLSPEEISELEARDIAEQANSARRAILNQLSALDAMMTPRLIFEVMSGEACTVVKPGCCIDGLTPSAAVAAINAQAKELRAQLGEIVYYESL